MCKVLLNYFFKRIGSKWGIMYVTMKINNSFILKVYQSNYLIDIILYQKNVVKT